MLKMKLKSVWVWIRKSYQIEPRYGPSLIYLKMAPVFDKKIARFLNENVCV